MGQHNSSCACEIFTNREIIFPHLYTDSVCWIINEKEKNKIKNKLLHIVDFSFWGKNLCGAFHLTSDNKHIYTDGWYITVKENPKVETVI